jgi:hypothetical protein
VLRPYPVRGHVLLAHASRQSRSWLIFDVRLVKNAPQRKLAIRVACYVVIAGLAAVAMSTAVAIKRDQLDDDDRPFRWSLERVNKFNALSPSEAYLRGKEDGERGMSGHLRSLASIGKMVDLSAAQHYRHAGFIVIELARSHNEIDANLISQYRRGWFDGSQMMRPIR